MLLTDAGIDQLESWRDRIACRFSEIMFGRTNDSNESYQVVVDRGENRPIDRSARSQPEADLMRFRSRLRSTSAGPAMSQHEQRARVLALRGLSQARDGEYERAQTSFASAARMDPGLDLAMLPTFWNLPRRAHDVAIAALHDANRGRDAAALTATVRTRFRPRALRGMNPVDNRLDERNE